MSLSAVENDRLIRDNDIDTDVEESDKEHSFACPRHDGPYWEQSIVSFTLNLGTMWRWVVNFTLRPLYTWERIPVSIK